MMKKFLINLIPLRGLRRHLLRRTALPPLAHIIVNAALSRDGVDEWTADFLRHYFMSIAAQRFENWETIWLVAITKSYLDGEKTSAERLLRKYIAKFGAGNIKYYEGALRLAHEAGLGNEDLDRAVRVYDQIRGIRAERRFENLIKGANKIAIVGRSPILLGGGLGAEIDSHDVVIRFNNSDVGGKYSADYGTKTNVNVVNMRVESNCPDDVLCLCKDFRTYDVIPDVLSRIEQNIDKNIDVFDSGLKEWCCSESGLDDPTSGALIIMWVRKILGTLDNVGIYGFAFQDPSRNLNHFDAGHAISTAKHDMGAESAFLTKLVKEGKFY
jgi:hypothetical protein